MLVAIQGAPGSYHHIAAEAFFGANIELVCCETFAELFDALENKRADVALTAVENSIAGSVHAVYDLMLHHDFFITGEVYAQVHHCLIGLPGVSIEQIERVYSHPMALPQCSDFLVTKLPDAERIEYPDTAASVTHVKKLGDIHSAAIASDMAARINDMPILARNIENFKNNVTRFVVLERCRPTSAKEADKASIVLETPNSPGALYHALGVFAKADANLTKLESRPIPDEPWRYQFLVDIEATKTQLGTCARDLEAQKCTVRILGEYKSNNMPA